MTMKPCPICNKASTEKFRPFCSGRCADVDLHRWMGEVYRVPVTATESDDELERMAEEEKPEKAH